jgi:hypothetical protein
MRVWVVFWFSRWPKDIVMGCGSNECLRVKRSKFLAKK